MRAVTWQGNNKVQVKNVPDPSILNGRDAIVRVSSTAICGSDLHLLQGFVPSMMQGDILGHEFMGEVIEVGDRVDGSKVGVGDRVVVPFPISCGACLNCRKQLYSACENSNPNAWMAEKFFGFPMAGVYGYSHLTGGYAGGQAEYVRVPFADSNAFKVPEGMSDEQALFLSDVLPTGWMGAEMCDIESGDVIAIWGAGPVGLLAMESARVLGAEHIIVIDRFDYRLQKAAERGAQTINYERENVSQVLKMSTGGRGPDKVIEAVGLEGHSAGGQYLVDKAKQVVKIETDRPTALREAIVNCRSGGIVSVVGAYGGFIDSFPMGAVMNRSLTIRAGQAHVQRYMQPLLERIQSGEIDPTFIISHVLPLEEAPAGYDMFKNKQDECTKIILKPNLS